MANKTARRHLKQGLFQIEAREITVSGVTDINTAAGGMEFTYVIRQEKDSPYAQIYLVKPEGRVNLGVRLNPADATEAVKYLVLGAPDMRGVWREFYANHAHRLFHQKPEVAQKLGKMPFRHWLYDQQGNRVSRKDAYTF